MVNECKQHEFVFVREEYPIMEMPQKYLILFCKKCGLSVRKKVEDKK